MQIRNRYETQGYWRIVFEDGSEILEHRYVMELHIGRKLLTEEFVHHIDFNSLNNEIGNLQIVTHAEHMAIHARGITLIELECNSCKIKFSRDVRNTNCKISKGQTLFYCSRECMHGNGKPPTRTGSGSYSLYLEYMKDNPDASINGSAKDLNVNRSVINFWRKRFKNESGRGIVACSPALGAGDACSIHAGQTNL